MSKAQTKKRHKAEAARRDRARSDFIHEMIETSADMVFWGVHIITGFGDEGSIIAAQDHAAAVVLANSYNIGKWGGTSPPEIGTLHFAYPCPWPHPPIKHTESLAAMAAATAPAPDPANDGAPA